MLSITGWMPGSDRCVLVAKQGDAERRAHRKRPVQPQNWCDHRGLAAKAHQNVKVRAVFSFCMSSLKWGSVAVVRDGLARKAARHTTVPGRVVVLACTVDDNVARAVTEGLPWQL
jgi:hypothetical protein